MKLVFFDLFLFATGYKVGPQFFRGLKKNALTQAALTFVLCGASLVTTVAAARLMDYDSGTAAGLMAGAFTESTVIGTAGNTIDRLDMSAAEKEEMQNNIPVAYAVSYLVGTGFVVWFLSSLAPRLLGVDLREETRKLEAQHGVQAKSETGDEIGLSRVGLAGVSTPETLLPGARFWTSSGPSLRTASSSSGSAADPACSTLCRRPCSRKATWP